MAPIMKKPPPTLDGAQVVWWAWDEIAFGQLYGAEGADRWIHGFAVCRYEDGLLYRFSCNKDWKVVQDMDHVSEDEAKSDLPANYDSSRVSWQQYHA